MTETIEYEQFDQAEQPSGAAAPEVDLARLSDIPMELSVEIGRTHMTVGETLDLRPGAVVMLERVAGEAADLLVNGTAIARGEVVVVEERYGLRVTEILDEGGDSQAPHSASAGGDDAARAEGAPVEGLSSGEG